MQTLLHDPEDVVNLLKGLSTRSQNKEQDTIRIFNPFSLVGKRLWSSTLYVPLLFVNCC